jgi:hypothetical protein
VVGPRPEKAAGLKDYPRSDEEIRKLAGELWGDCDGKTIKERTYGQGRVIWGKALRDVLTDSGTAPDFEYAGKDRSAFLDFIHRRDGNADIYFIANRLDREESARCLFRVTGRQPELWDPVTGAMRDAAAFSQADGRTTVPLDFAPYGSIFVIFRQPIAASRQGTAASNSPRLSELLTLNGSWTVRFDPAWGGPEKTHFEQLRDWTKSDQVGIRYYSGAADYDYESFDLPESLTLNPQAPLYLDLGGVRNVAGVKLNGKELDVLWTRPFRLEISGAVKPKANRLEIRVTNLWPNRLIGDAALPADKRFTRTHVAKFKNDSALLPSGLLGPVRILIVK